VPSDIGWTGLAASVVLVAVAVALSLVRGLRLEGSIVWAAARAVVQLLLVGVALDVVLDSADAWSWAWVAAMVLFAADTVRRRAREVPGVMPLALAAFAAAAVVTLTVLFGLGVFPLEPRTLIPLAGMMVGNSMTSTVLVARRVLEELRDKRDEVEARLALGLASGDAARPYLRAALRTALVPQIETTKSVGLVFLPGAMTGLILAGVDPIEAVRVQAAVMYLVLGAVATTVTVVGLGVQRRLFTADHRLVVPARPPD
jgi:putative ABC transport system permease protein